MNKEINIPILPHLKKFIYKFYRIETGESVNITMNSSMGIAMKHTLREKKKINKRFFEKYTESIDLILCSDLSHLQTMGSIIRQFTVEYNKIFRENMRQWISAQDDAGINESSAIKNFLAFYGIKESEYSYDSAQRDWGRYKNSEYERIKQRKLVQKCA